MAPVDVQTVLVWLARLACSIALAVTLWLLLREPAAAPEPSAEQRLTEMNNRRAALELEIRALEARMDDEVPVAKAPLLAEEPSAP